MSIMGMFNWNFWPRHKDISCITGPQNANLQILESIEIMSPSPKGPSSDNRYKRSGVGGRICQEPCVGESSTLTSPVGGLWWYCLPTRVRWEGPQSNHWESMIGAPGPHWTMAYRVSEKVNAADGHRAESFPWEVMSCPIEHYRCVTPGKQAPLPCPTEVTGVWWSPLKAPPWRPCPRQGSCVWRVLGRSPLTFLRRWMRQRPAPPPPLLEATQLSHQSAWEAEPSLRPLSSLHDKQPTNLWLMGDREGGVFHVKSCSSFD